MQWWNDRRMREYVLHELDQRFQSKHGRSGTGRKDQSKTIIDLALDTYVGEGLQNGTQGTFDATFRDLAVSQVRTFIFAGHDSTGSTISYAFHLLSSHPSVRQLLIEEHNRVLGPEHDQAVSRITENTNLVNRLPYTLAVIKETLRLYPPASSTRSGEPNFTIRGPDGHQFPTEGFLVWSHSFAIHHDTKYWPEPQVFLPERWLVEDDHYLFPRKGAYRPFEFGPRNCIGQELALLELKLVLILTAREFVIRSVYDEWDQSHPRSGAKTLDGDRAYQVLYGAAHPSDGLPCRVSLAI